MCPGRICSRRIVADLASVGRWARFILRLPLVERGASASTINKGAIVWLIIIQIIASAMGGYLAGRLRTKWATIHTDEVYFPDTAHGFLLWAVGLVITASFLSSAAASIVGATQGATSFSTAGGNGTVTELPGGQKLDPSGYFIDTLFRSDHPSADRSYAPVRAEAARIQRSVEVARKAVADLSLWIFVALLIGAFCASYAAIIGGSQRDHVELV